MKKNAKSIMMLLWLCFAFIKANGQDSMFYFLDKTSLTNNVLCPYNDTTSWGLYDGVKENTCKNMHVANLLSELNYWTFGINNRQSADSIKIKSFQLIRNSGVIPILIINQEYTRIKANARNDSLIYLSNGKYYDILPRSQSPFENKILFAAAPLKEKIYNGMTKFILSRDYFVSNLPAEIRKQTVLL
nr:hypothetical protein [Bacteroidota bacterium]